MRQAAVMLILNKEGLILSISRRDDKNKFGLPGGKVDAGETHMAAAIRETKEETSIIVKHCQYIYSRVEPARLPGGNSYDSYTYFATDWEGEPISSEEGEVKWLTAADLVHEMGAFPKYNRDMLDRFKIIKPLLEIMYPTTSLFIKGE